MNIEQALILLDEFYQLIDSIYGLYLDALMGFSSNVKQMNAAQAFMISQPGLNKTIEEFDLLSFSYSDSAPNEPYSVEKHICTQGELKIRNSDSGANHTVLGNVCITQIYQYWEDYYRGKVAENLGISKNDFRSDVFGDIRLFRNAITHHRAIALVEIDRFKFFKWFNKDEPIAFTKKQIDEIMRTTKAEIIAIMRPLVHGEKPSHIG